MSFRTRATQANIDLSGFWVRNQGETLCGKLVKFVPNDKDPKHIRPFFIFLVTANDSTDNVPTISVTADGKTKKGKKGAREERLAEVGDYVGVAANYALTSTLDISKDAGKACRLTVNGTAPNPNGPIDMILITVEVDDGVDDESVPL